MFFTEDILSWNVPFETVALRRLILSVVSQGMGNRGRKAVGDSTVEG